MRRRELLTPDQQLLCEYVERGSQAAFAQLVERHQSIIYSTCLREVHDTALAEDVTQVVLLLLAMKAPALKGHTAVSGWLFQTARFASRNARRKEMHRRRAEQAAAEEQEAYSAQSIENIWESAEVLLNRALLSLRPGEREAILLRFFEDRSVDETGLALGISKGAAQMRISRAVGKLRRYFARRGIALSGAALLGLLSTRTIHAMSQSCHEATCRIAGGVAAGRRPASSGSIDTMTRGVLRAMWTTKLQTSMLLASVLLFPFAVRIVSNGLAIAAVPSKNESRVSLAVDSNRGGTQNESNTLGNAVHSAVDQSAANSGGLGSGLVSAHLASYYHKGQQKVPTSVADHSLDDDPQIRRRVTIKTEGIALGELFALWAKQTGVRLQVDDYTADDKVIILGPPRPMNEIMADIAALYNDTWLHSRDGERHTYRLTRLPIARDDEDKLANEMNRTLLAHLEEQIKALDETPEQLAKRPETDSIRQMLTVNENRVTTSILALLSQEQREQLIDRWRVDLPVSLLSSTQKDGIEGLFHGKRFDALLNDPLFTSGNAAPPVAISRDQMDQYGITFEVLNSSGANHLDSNMTVYLKTPPVGFSKTVATFSTRSRFLLPPHGDPYSRQKVPATASLTDAMAADAFSIGVWPDRLRSFAERTGRPVVADYYRSKSVFAPGDDDEESPKPTVAALDNFCRSEGYMWWNRGKSLLFRKRDWYNQRLYEVPDRWVLAMCKNLHSQAGVPTVADLLALLDLSTNQIAGLSESLGISSDRRQLIGLRALLTAVTAMPVDKNMSIWMGPITDARRAAILPDLRDVRQRALLQSFAEVFDPKLFTNPNLVEFGVVFQCSSKDAVASRIEVCIYQKNKSAEQSIRFGYRIALPVSLPDDRRDKTIVRVES
jgi:RNA polymerase sigma factor (sigma-70 family)